MNFELHPTRRCPGRNRIIVHEWPCLLKARNKAKRKRLMINKKIMPVEKTKRTDFGIFGKFVADLYNMPIFIKTGIKLDQLY
jgi:hypothetical protein